MEDKMKKILIYTLDMSRLRKIGEPGYRPYQEQAQNYHEQILPDHQNYLVKIFGSKLIVDFFNCLNIPYTPLEPKDNALLLSIDYIDDGKYQMVAYWHPVNKTVCHAVISNLVSNELEFALTRKIIAKINAFKQSFRRSGNREENF